MSPYQLPTIKDARHCWMWIALCVIAFLLTALAVHQLGSSIRSGERIYRATAIVEQCSAGVVADAAAGSEQAGLPSAPSIKSQLLGEQTLRGVLGGLAWAQRQSQTANEALIARVKRSVDVQTSRPSASCMRVAISYTSADRTEAVEVVNALARHYAELHHTRREAIARQRHHEARVAAGAARCELEKAEARLQAFLERQIRRQQQAGPSKPGAATAAQQQPPPSGSPRVQATKSPAPGQRRWLEEQLDSLGKERSRLLADRTPLHPEVLHLDGLIADMKAKIASLGTSGAGQAVVERGRPSIGGAAVPSGAASTGTAERQLAAAIDRGRQAEVAGRLEALKGAVAQARAVYGRRVKAEQEAWRRYLSVPEINLALAANAEVVGPETNAVRLALLSLSCALGVSLGLGMIFWGTHRDRPVENVGQLERWLDAPVLGTVPIDGLEGDDAGRPAQGGAGKRAVLVCGMVLIAACLGVVVHTFSAG